MRVLALVFLAGLAATLCEPLWADGINSRLLSAQEEFKESLTRGASVDPSRFQAAVAARHGACIRILENLGGIDDVGLPDDEVVALSNICGLARQYKRQVEVCGRNLSRQSVGSLLRRHKVVAHIQLRQYFEASNCLLEGDSCEPGMPLADLNFPLMGFLASNGANQQALLHGRLGLKDMLVRTTTSPASVACVRLWIAIFTRVSRTEDDVESLEQIRAALDASTKALTNTEQSALSACVSLELVACIAGEIDVPSNEVDAAINNWDAMVLSSSSRSNTERIEAVTRVIQFAERDWSKFRHATWMWRLLGKIDAYLGATAMSDPELKQTTESLRGRLKLLTRSAEGGRGAMRLPIPQGDAK